MERRDIVGAMLAVFCGVALPERSCAVALWTRATHNHTVELLPVGAWTIETPHRLLVHFIRERGDITDWVQYEIVGGHAETLNRLEPK